MSEAAKTPRTFTIAGTSTINGVKTFRVANGKLNLRRIALKHYGHVDIELQELPKPMTKLEAVAFLAGNGVDAVVPTRAKDKTAKTALQIEAEKLAMQRMSAAEAPAEQAAA